MRRLIAFAAALLLVGAAVAAEKVVDSSSKKRPDWAGASMEGYFVTSAQAPTLEEAQEKAITAVREQIIAAVATNIHSETSIVMREVAENGHIDSHKEMKSELHVAAADIPYLADISPSHAKDFYWLKMRRDDKSTYYVYHLLYPFSNSKLRMLVMEYEKAQKAINDSLQAFASTDFEKYGSVEQMLARHNGLQQFEASLREDDKRRDICQSILMNYDRMLRQNLHVEVLESNRQETRICMKYASKRIACHMKPKMKSNCLVALQAKLNAQDVQITYDSESGCYADDQNWLDVTFTILGKRITQRCYIR